MIGIGNGNEETFHNRSDLVSSTETDDDDCGRNVREGWKVERNFSSLGESENLRHYIWINFPGTAQHLESTLTITCPGAP